MSTVNRRVASASLGALAEAQHVVRGATRPTFASSGVTYAAIGPSHELDVRTDEPTLAVFLTVSILNRTVQTLCGASSSSITPRLKRFVLFRRCRSFESWHSLRDVITILGLAMGL